MSAIHEIRPDKKYGYVVGAPILIMVAFLFFGMVMMVAFVLFGDLMLTSGRGERPSLLPGSLSFTILSCPFFLCFMVMTLGMFAPFGAYIWNGYKSLVLEVHHDRLILNPDGRSRRRQEVMFSDITSISVARNWIDQKLGLGQVVIFVADDSPQGVKSFTMPGLADPEGTRGFIENRRRNA